ncbi:MAG: NAD-dependent epimerase/dehydratase family protein [Flavobacteriia bacterium]|nr:NAD-dependent epimerase/dehydratase family protein [Flavobacteriia bacterium]
MKSILIAGGTGLIGQKLVEILTLKGNNVFILTRNPSAINEFYWDPSKNEIDSKCFEHAEVLINLCGEGIVDKPWTRKRRALLYASRIETTKFLYSNKANFINLKHFISASGVNCYNLEKSEQTFQETDSFGADYISQLVKEWESAADLFSDKIKVSKLRISVVFSKKGGALAKIKQPIINNVGAVLGSGNQLIPWIHIEDLCLAFSHVIESELDGVYNLNAGNISNKMLTCLRVKIILRC